MEDLFNQKLDTSPNTAGGSLTDCFQVSVAPRNSEIARTTFEVMIFSVNTCLVPVKKIK